MGVGEREEGVMGAGYGVEGGGGPSAITSPEGQVLWFKSSFRGRRKEAKKRQRDVADADL